MKHLNGGVATIHKPSFGWLGLVQDVSRDGEPQSLGITWTHAAVSCAPFCRW